MDAAAAADLTRVATPWLLDEVTWTDELVLRAVVWLSRTTGKAILKLTERDYAEHQLSSLVAKHGTAGDVNGMIFNALGARIRGRSKLPRGKRIICFSPHPDDDVISMGGILRKLVLNENHITVAYMTSGNIAVFDHDVRRHVDFLVRLARDQQLDVDGDRGDASHVCSSSWPRSRPATWTARRCRTSSASSASRRRCRASRRWGCRAQGRALPQPAVLPDRQGAQGSDRAGRRGDREAAAAGRGAGHVFVAGDLSDPHGTHRMCKEAIERRWPSWRRDDDGASPRRKSGCIAARGRNGR